MKFLSHLNVLLILMLVLVGTLSPNQLHAQRGKNGSPTIISTNTVVNSYTSVSADVLAGSITIAVTNNTLNTHFSSALAAGDLILIIQIQGVTTNGVLSGNLGNPPDSSWGTITNYNNCGNWEFAEVKNVSGSTSITVDCPLIHSYTAAGKTQVVRVPRYSSLIINTPGSITCDIWNGIVGGICVTEVENNTIINAGGSIDVSGKGFRGGALLENLSNSDGVAWIPASTKAVDGSEKGEGVAGYQRDYDLIGGRYCKASPANGGGGGNSHNAGGGGGANGGNPASWNGIGVPDISVAGYITAWNLEYAGLAALTSSGGGKGGYCWSANVNDPTVYGPGTWNNPGNIAIWGGDHRYNAGGFGGRPLDYSTGKLFLGGGGGSGDQNDAVGGAGANGGGLIYLMNYGTVSGSGQFISNGNRGSDAPGKDGAGGGGGGGTIIVNSVGAITNVTMTANGGNGGDQKYPALGILSQAEGPGGGGGGGYIAISNGTPARTVNGGNNGVTNSSGLIVGGINKFPPNGATKGGAGTTNAAIKNFVITAANTTICAGQSATLNATLTPSQSGTTIVWYDAIVAGNVIGTGPTYTVSPVTTTTYYVGTCPGTYRQPIVVTVTSSIILTTSGNTTICTGYSATLTASGASSYSWSTNPIQTTSLVIVSPTVTTTYSVTSGGTCPGTATISVNVTSSVLPTTSGNTTICTGSSVILTASGASSYLWSTTETTTAITVSPTTTTIYSVTSGGACPGTATISVTVASSIPPTTSGNTTICTGSSATLTASGASSYLWSTSETTTAITVTPTATAIYSVTSGGACSGTATISVTVASSIPPTTSGNTTICTGSSAILTASGASSYLWSTTETTTTITVSPTTTTIYSVTSGGACPGTATISVTVASSIPPTTSGNTTICTGSSATLTASGASSYLWSTTETTTAITVSPTATTIYSVTSGGACSGTSSVSVSVLPSPTVTVSSNTTICRGDNTTLNASGGTSYTWINGATSSAIIVSPSTTTIYSVIATTGICFNIGTVTVSVSPPPTASIKGNNICQGYIGTLTASGGGTYLWSTGETTATINPTAAGTYSVVVSIGTCTGTDVKTITVNSNPIAIAFSDVTIFQGQSANLSATGGTTFVWDNSMNGPNITVSPLSTTVYCVTVYDANNCYDAACITVTVEPCFRAGTLYLPNAFSPNGDGENDDLQIYYGATECIKTFHLVLYTRWGERVYETNDPAFKWNGVYNSGLLKNTQQGSTEVYAYYMVAEIADGTKISKKGNISLIR